MARTERRAQTVVCDAGPVIHLDELGCLSLLADFHRIILPGAVWREVKRHRPAALQHAEVDLKRVDCGFETDSQVHALSMTLTLHTGETEALQLALRRQAAMFLTDDAAARLAARALGLTVHGTIGILTRAIRRKQKSRDEVVSILLSIPKKSTLFVSRSLLLEVIAQIKQES